MISIELSARFAQPFEMRFNAINETAIRSLCGGKAESSGCLQSRSQLLATNRANTREMGRPNSRVVVELLTNVVTDRRFGQRLPSERAPGASRTLMPASVAGDCSPE